MLALALCARTLSAQPVEPAPASSGTPASIAALPPPELTVAGVEERIKLFETSTEFDDSTKSRLLESYRRALEQLRAASTWSRKAVEFERDRLDAPLRLATIRAELESPPAELQPEFAPESSAAQLEQFLAQAEADLNALQAESASLEDERKRRNERKQKAPEEGASARQRLQEVASSLETPPPADQPPAITAATTTEWNAERVALEKKIAALEQEVLSYGARGDLLNARRDLAGRRLVVQEALVKSWRDVVSEARHVEAEQAARETRKKRREVASADPVVRELAERNERLAELRTRLGLAEKIRQASTDLDAATATAKRLTDERDGVAKILATGGIGESTGLLLRRKLESLPSASTFRRRIAHREAELPELRVQALEAEDELYTLSHIEPLIESSLAKLETSTNEADRTEIASQLRDLLESRRKYLESIAADFDAYLVSLPRLNAAERDLIDRVREYENYIREHILWVPSAAAVGVAESRDWDRASRNWLDSTLKVLSGDEWSTAVARAWVRLRSSPQSIVVGLLLVAWNLVSRAFSRRLVEAGDAARRRTASSMTPTLRAVLYTFLLTFRIPVLLWFGAWAVGSSLDATDFAKGVASAMIRVGALVAEFELIRQLCRPRGLVEAHFDVEPGPLRVVQRNALWLVLVRAPLMFLGQLASALGDEAASATIGRAAFILSQVVMAYGMHRILSPRHGVVMAVTKSPPTARVVRWKALWYALGMAFPAGWAFAAAWGYYYTAQELALRFHISAGAMVLLSVVYGLALRWLAVAGKRLALEQFRKRLLVARAAAAEAGTGATETTLPLEEPDISVAAVSTQTRKLIRAAGGFVTILVLWAAWVDVLPALGVLDRVELWTTTVSRAVPNVSGAVGVPQYVDATVPVTLSDVALALLILFVTVIALQNVPGLLEIALLANLPLQASSRYAIKTITRYAITIIGAVVSFGMIGITWSKVQWLAAAVTVGLGFGLQEIFANFVSGLIILFERPIRVGDIVQVGGIEGRVTRIHMRATTIMDYDRRELLVPNKDFITGQVINWTLTDSTARVVVPVGVAYGSDPELVRDLLLKVAKRCELVLGDPAPSAIFRSFGDNALNFELRVFMESKDHGPELVDVLHTGINEEFQRAGIEIPFPQRDIHIRAVPPGSTSGAPAALRETWSVRKPGNE